MKSEFTYQALITVSLMVLSLTLNGCNSNSTHYDPDQYSKFNKVYMGQARNNPIEKQILIGDTASVAYNAAFAGAEDPKNDITAQFSVNPALVDTFNADNSTSYPILPKKSYTMGDTQAVIQAGKRRSEKGEIKINANSNIKPDKTYLLPVSMAADTEKIPLISKWETAYFLIHINNISSRSIKGGGFTPNLDLFLKWGDITDRALGTVVKYTNTSNKPDSLFVPNDSTQTVISNYKINSTIIYETQYSVASGIISSSSKIGGEEFDRIYLANDGPDFKHADWDGERWGDLQDWKANKAVKTHLGYGGWGYAFNKTAGPGLIVFSSYPTFSTGAPLDNAKVYKNLELPAGSYSFNIYIERNFELTGGNKVYVAAAKGDTLPNQEDIDSSIISYIELGNVLGHGDERGEVANLKFTLNQKTNITIGFIATVNGYKFARISKVRLKIK